MPSLSVHHLTASGVSAAELEVAAGHCVTLFGPSGGGKTLLLRAIADLDPNDGDIRLDGDSRAAMPAHQWRRRVNYVAAESAWWHDTVAPHCPTWPPQTLARLGFEQDVLDWEIARLSSGERQRLALARALAHAPEALLLDEPTANLDSDNTARVEALIAEWRETTRGCVLWVSHDPKQRERLGGRRFEVRSGRLADRADG
jgi:putative ABC transport system ATP-binding protein